MTEEKVRTIVLHYHLFKNAGTSLDHILKRNFGARWVTREFDSAQANNKEQVAQWIIDTPSAVAFSSHTMTGPLPAIDGVRIVPVMFLRDPIARIKSAYRFERLQTSDTWGSTLAKTHTFEGFVRARLARDGDRQCRNFQTGRLASMVHNGVSERIRAHIAMERIQKFGMLGLVDEFSSAVQTLSTRLKPHFPDFEAKVVRVNATPKACIAQHAAVVSTLLHDANQDDLELLSHLQSC